MGAAAGDADRPLDAGEAEALFAPLSGETQLLAAVSGGPDSIALLAMLHAWAQQTGRPVLYVATVDHRLRSESAKEAAGVGSLCAGLGLPHRVLVWHDGDKASALQAQARAARYALLAAYAQELGGAALVTAHTLDDQAETLLMRLARGSGPAGLAGMRPRSLVGGTVLYRPLLKVPKARLVATARAAGLPIVLDPSNGDRRFERVRWRDRLPPLAEAGLDAQRLGAFARRMARVDEAIEHRVAVVAQDRLVRRNNEASLPFAALLEEEPLEVVLRLVSRMIDTGSGPERLERLEACVSALAVAARTGRSLRRTLGGRILSLDRRGVLTARPEPVRRRGIHPAAP